VLQNIHRHLKKSGVLAFEFWNVRGVIPDSSSWHKAERDDIRIIRLSKSTFNPDTNIVSIYFDGYVLESNTLIDSFEEIHDLRVYSPREMRDSLERNGFETCGIYDNLTFENAKDDSFRLIAVARRV